MSIAAKPPADERPSDLPLARAVVPVLVAAGAVSLALAVVRTQPFAADAPAAQPPAEATPYSEMHRRVQEAPGEAEPLPPTF